MSPKTVLDRKEEQLITCSLLKLFLNKHTSNCAFMDLTKAYDRVSRDLLYYKLQVMGFSEVFIKIIQAMYSHAVMEIWWEGVSSGPIPIQMGLKQGCVLSPILFALYMADLNHFLMSRGEGVQLGSVMVPMLQFADDIALFSNSRVEFLKLLCAIGFYMDLWHLEISDKKIKNFNIWRTFSS